LGQPGYRNATFAVLEAAIPYNASEAAPVVGTVITPFAANCRPPVAVVPAVTVDPPR
jgi:hypothetical protein